MSAFERIALAVREANPTRNASNLDRRALKLIEEFGEAAQAYLNVTSPSNGKSKTWDDVREEIADVLIVALDIAWTPQEAGKFSRYCFMPDHIQLAKLHPLTESDILNAQRNFGRYLRIRNPDDLMELVEAIVSLAWTITPDQIGVSEAAFETRLEGEIERKLQKWTGNRAKMAVVTDDV